jgi:4-hydroxybenzoate polyprenyltransferase
MLTRARLLLAETMEDIGDCRRPLSYAVATFLSCTIIRTCIELCSTHLPLADVGPLYLHYLLWYVWVALAIILLLKGVTDESVGRLARVVLTAFVLVWICPSVDLARTLGRGCELNYLFPEDPVFKSFATFLGAVPLLTTGLRLEIAIVLALCAFYVVLRGGGVWRAVRAATYLYVFLFIALAAPCVQVPLYEALCKDYSYCPNDLSAFLVWGIAAEVVLLCLAQGLRRAAVLLRNARPMRIAHFLLLWGIGLGLAPAPHGGAIAGSRAAVPAALVMAWLASVLANDLCDREIDEISSAWRPLVSGVLTAGDCAGGSAILAALALGAASLHSTSAVLLTAVFIAVYFVYSCPPLRLKRVPVLSKLAVSANSLVAIILGFVTGGGDLYHFPSHIVFFFLVPVTLAANLIDLKDADGDRRAGISTLPVLIGDTAARRLVAFFLLAAYGCLCFVFRTRIPLMGLLLAAGLLQALLIARHNYKEAPVLALHVGVLLVLSAWAWHWPELFVRGP